jgi:Indigoidine synthase A like protein
VSFCCAPPTNEKRRQLMVFKPRGSVSLWSHISKIAHCQHFRTTRATTSSSFLFGMTSIWFQPRRALRQRVLTITTLSTTFPLSWRCHSRGNSVGLESQRYFASVRGGILKIDEAVQQALHENRPVVALESTLVAHGMPFPENVALCQRLSTIFRSKGVEPATIAASDYLWTSCTIWPLPRRKIAY